MEMPKYYIFETAILNWKNGSLKATLKNYTKIHTLMQERWWYRQELPMPTPEFTFEVDKGSPTPDNYWTATLFSLYSKKLVGILNEHQVSNEVFPAKVIEKRTGKFLPLDYFVFRLHEVNDAIDVERSVFRKETIANFSIERLQQMVLKEEFIKSEKLMARVLGHENITLIHESLKVVLDEELIQGCRYIPMDNNTADFIF